MNSDDLNEDYKMQYENESQNDKPMEPQSDYEINSQDAINQSQISLNNAQSVEDRLYLMKNIYQERRQQKLAQAEEERKKLEVANKPKINRKSEKMLKNKTERKGKIEDRLMILAQKKAAAKMSKDNEIDTTVHHSVHGSGKKSKNSQVVSRLLDYGALYKQKRLEKEQELKNQKFTPNIEKSNGNFKSIKSKVTDQFSDYKSARSEQDLDMKLDESEILPQNEDNKDDQSNFENYTENHLYTGPVMRQPTKRMQQIQDEYDSKLCVKIYCLEGYTFCI